MEMLFKSGEKVRYIVDFDEDLVGKYGTVIDDPSTTYGLEVCVAWDDWNDGWTSVDGLHKGNCWFVGVEDIVRV